MKVFIVRRGEKRIACTVPYEGAIFVDADGLCPNCNDDAFKVSGRNQRIAGDDRAYEADAIALCCGAHVGTLRAETNTLFGVREDEAVLNGRCRVY